MSKTIKYLILLVVAMSLALASCSVDKPENTGVAKTTGHQVKFTLSSGKMMTRAAAAVSGFDREKAISSIYAVSFKSDGTYHGTHSVSVTSEGYGFDIGAAGAYYIYVVANPTIENFATKQYDDEAAFLADVETADPGADLAASTNFLMLSRRTLADVDAENETDLGTIEMIRAAARIDIDATAISGIEIKQVTVKNRYTSTKLSRMGGDADMTGLTKQDAKVYTRGIESGQIAAINNTTALVNNEQWQGVIYCYENLVSSIDATAITVLEITHELDGIESTTEVPFENTPLKRNGLYTVKLDWAALADVQEINYTIIVVDWNSVGLAFTGITDIGKPSFSVTSMHSANATTNPTMVRAKRNEDNTIRLKVISGGAMGSEVVFMGGVVRGDNEYTIEEYTAANSGTPISEPTNTYNATTGKLEQAFSIAVPKTLAENMLSSDYLRFRVCNQYDASQYQEFDIKSGYAMTATLSSSSVTYNGSAQQPSVATVTVYDDNNTAHPLTSSEYDVAYSDNINAGTGHVTVTAKDGTPYAGASATVDFTINKATATLTLNPTALTVKYGSGAPVGSITATVNHGELDGQAPTFTWNAGTYATIGTPTNFNGSHQSTISVTGLVEQTTAQTLTVNIPATDNYTAAQATCAIKVVNETGIALSSATVGMIICSHGYAHEATTGDLDCGGEKVAIVAYMGNGEANTSYNTGLAIAMTDVGVWTKWKSSADGTCTTQGFLSSVLSDLNGLAYTATLVSDGHGHDAAIAANGYSVAHPTGTSQWFLPTIGQWNLMVKAMCGDYGDLIYNSANSNYVADIFNTKINAAGGTGVMVNRYWSSVEYGTSSAWTMVFDSGYVGNNSKSASLPVRPVLAF